MNFQRIQEFFFQLRNKIEEATDATLKGTSTKKQGWMTVGLFTSILCLLVGLTYLFPTFILQSTFRHLPHFYGLIYLPLFVFILNQMQLALRTQYTICYLLIFFCLFYFVKLSFLTLLTYYAIFSFLICSGFLLLKILKNSVLSGFLQSSFFHFLTHLLGAHLQISVPPLIRHERLVFLLSSNTSLKNILHPVHWIYPIPMHEQPQHQNKLQAEALFDLCMALCKLLLFLGLSLSYEMIPFKMKWWPLKSLVLYLIYFTFSTSLPDLCSAAMRLSGFNVSRGSDFALLATNPAERWRKWNIPFYEWFMAYIYYPSFRRFKSHILSLLLVFVFTFYLHNGTRVFGLIEGLSNTDFVRLQKSFIFFMLHALVVAIGFLKPQWFPNNFIGWSKTFTLMLLVHLWQVFNVGVLH